MKTETKLAVGRSCFVRIPDETFLGMVEELRDSLTSQHPGWVRVVGKGNIEGAYFDEWFPIDSNKCWVYPAAT